MRRLFPLLLILIASVMVSAQVSPPKPIPSSGTLPSTCYYANTGRVDEYYKTGVTNPGFYTCASNGTSWNGPYPTSGGSGTVTSVTGTANQINVATGTTTPVLSVSSTLVAPGTITATTSTASPFFVSTNADPADAGAIRLGNAELIEWEASPAGTDVTLTVNSSEQFVFSAALLSPALVTPDLGTPTALVGTNITGTAAGLTAGTVTTNANLTGDVTSTGNATAIATGVIVNADVNASAAIAYSKLALTGSIVNADITNSTIDLTAKVTGILPAANGGTGINNSTRTLTIGSNAGTLTFGAASKTLTVNNSIALTGTDSTVMTFPTTTATIARTDAGQTFTGTNVFGVVTATSLNGNTFTTGTYTLTGAAAKVLTFNNTLTLAGTDSTTMTFPATSASVARIDALQTFVGNNIFTGPIINMSGSSSQAWDSARSVLQIGGNGGLMATTARAAGGGLDLLWGAYFDGTNYKYVSTEAVSDIGQTGGTILFRTAPSGTAGNTATYATQVLIGNTGIVTLNTTNYNTCTGLTTSSAVITCTVSDERVKNDITPFTDGMSAIRKINPITFQFSKGTQWYKGGRTELGLSAQNLKAANPLLATLTGNDLNLLQPEPMALHAIEIDAIKKLDARLTTLEKENKSLKRKH